MNLNVVYHVASMGDWQPVVLEQFALMRDYGLDQFLINVTHVGPADGLRWVEEQASAHGLTIRVDRHDEQILHYETFAILLIERLAKTSDDPFLYFHTKGVSASWHDGKRKWRHVMQREVVARWRENVEALADFDAVGVNWHSGDNPHFSGNFWVARADWIRKLPDFATYHAARQHVRTNCEFWIGAKGRCRAKSLLCRNHSMWYDNYNWSQWFPLPEGARVNIGSGDYPMKGWVNFDVRPDVRPDIVGDIGTYEFAADSLSEIYCGHLLEHVADPLSLLKRSFNWLKKDGKLTITVPDFGVASQMYHGLQPLTSPEFTGDRIIFGLTNPPEQRHLQAFTPATLMPLFQMAGFKDVTRLGHCPYWVAPVPWQFSVEGTK